MPYSRVVEYTNYPQNYTDPLAQPAGGEEGGAVEFRFPPLYEYINKDWQIVVSYIWADDDESPTPIPEPIFDVVGVTHQASYGHPWRKFTVTIIEDPDGNKAQIDGWWQDVFDQNQFDFRMNDESVVENIDIELIGYDTESSFRGGSYGPVEFRPDPRVALEGEFSIEVEMREPIPSGASGDTSFTDTVKHTVMNNWEANRLRLLDYRDNLKRGEQTEAELNDGSGNTGDIEVEDPDGIGNQNKVTEN